MATSFVARKVHAIACSVHYKRCDSKFLARTAEGESEMEEAKQWSPALRAASIEALSEIAVSPDGFLHMKHINGKFGAFTLVDLVMNIYALKLKNESETLQFADADSVVAAGWAID
jgi:hypothetical protein